MKDDAALTRLLHRAAVYRLLALAFAYPTPARLEAIAADGARASAGAGASLRPVIERLVQAAGSADSEALAGEHVALFQRALRCPPYEGAWGPPQMAGKGPLLADLAGFYAAFHLAPSDGQPEVEDHIGAELEFMSALALKEAWALADNDTAGLEVTCAAQRAFVADHLGRWTGAFAARVTSEAAVGFLPAAAALLVAWLDEECLRLGVAAVPLEGVSPAEVEPFACPMAATGPDAG